LCVWSCCRDVITPLFACIQAMAHCWACFYASIVEPRFTLMYPRTWTCIPSLKLWWNLFPTFLNIVDDQVVMKLACCYFVSSNSFNLLIVVNVVNVFFAWFVFLSFYSLICFVASLSIAFCYIIFKYSFEVTITWFWE